MIIHLIPVTMTLVNRILSIDLARCRIFHKATFLLAHAHCATQIRVRIACFHVTILVHPFHNETDNRMRRIGIVFSCIGVFETRHISCDINNRSMKPITNTQVGHFIFTGIFRCKHLTLKPAITKSARNQNGISML